jgi:hypothetical protein
MHSDQTRATLIITAFAAIATAGLSPAAAEPADSDDLDPRVDKILTRLEQRAVHDLRAAVTWKLRYVIDLEEDATVKKGRIWYKDDEPVAKFLVHFDKKIVNNRLRELDERHLFDGRWYVERNSDTKTVTRREIRREGEEGNPYKLGEGPFPVPFGQKKEDILAEFAVQLVPPGEEDPENTDHIKLVPRAGSRTGQSYKYVDVWVARRGRHEGLPVKVQTAKLAGTGKVNSYLTITFDPDKTDLNAGFSSGVFKIETPPGFHEEVERLETVRSPAPTAEHAAQPAPAP